MQTQQIPTSQRLHDLTRRRQQLEMRLRRYGAVVDRQPLPNPSLGRALDDTQALLAKVRAELRTLEARSASVPRP